MQTGYKYVKRMAKDYRRIHPNLSIGLAVHKAYEAYDIYRDAEVDIRDEYYQKENDYETGIRY